MRKIFILLLTLIIFHCGYAEESEDFGIIVSPNGEVIETSSNSKRKNPQSRRISSYQWGVGFMLGEPSGLSMKYDYNIQHRFDLGIGHSFNAGNRLAMHVDYLYKFHGLIPVSKGLFFLYAGGGMRLGSKHKGGHNRARIGLRLPGGAVYQLESVPAEFFGELAAITDMLPGFGLGFSAAVGLRILF